MRDSAPSCERSPDGAVLRKAAFSRRACLGLPTFCQSAIGFMRLTRFTDNALRCLMYLGRNPDRVVTVGEVSRRMGMSEDHLLKVVRRLVDLGHVRTLRGRTGGLRLNRAPSEIVVADVVRATEDNLALVPCFQREGPACPMGPECRLSGGALNDALLAIFRSAREADAGGSAITSDQLSGPLGFALYPLRYWYCM